MIDLVDIIANYLSIKKYRIELLYENTQVVIKEFLPSINAPNISSITISSEDYINESNNITPEYLNIMFPEFLLPLQ